MELNAKKPDKQCIVLFSGGLDSRLAVKIMQEKGFDVTALFFKLPFINEKISEIEKFCKDNQVKLEIVDCTKGDLLHEYLEVLRKPYFSRGKGFNPCIDCKIFILKKTKEFADKKGIELIVTGDVVGERPLSQTKKALKKIEEKSDLSERIFRPLSAKLLESTEAEKKGMIRKEEFYDIQGRKREKQSEIAERFGIDYPNPSGGCLLCEPELKKRFKELFYRNLNEKQVRLMNLGRHFIIEGYWIILGRNQEENETIEKVMEDEKENIIVPDYPAPTAVIFSDSPSGEFNENIREKTRKLIKTYSKKGSEKEKNMFEEYRL